MELLAGNQIKDHLEGLLHEKTQVQAHAVDLTAGQVYRPTHPGRLDFGGSEFQGARQQRLEPKKQNPDDDYGWWILDHGDYQVELNETLRSLDGLLAVIRPHEHLVAASAFLPAITWERAGEPITLPLHVGDNGCRIKENARIAQLMIYKLKDA